MPSNVRMALFFASCNAEPPVSATLHKIIFKHPHPGKSPINEINGDL
jgi:hypothetical protein